MMEGRGFGFVTYKDPTSAQRFLEVSGFYTTGDERHYCGLSPVLWAVYLCID